MHSSFRRPSTAQKLSNRTLFPWPVFSIDFEASSLDQDGYPIEVGLALWPGPDDAIYGWSTLIRPAGEWSRLGHWSPKSAKVHGLRGSDLLAHGLAVRRVAECLNATLGSGTVAWCDGDAYDAHWIAALFGMAKIVPAFALGDWYRLTARLDPAARERGLTWLENAQARHRAREDAEQLLLTLAHAIGVDPGPVQDLVHLRPELAALTSS